ncbi:hypothetical protein [Streptomyces fulvoviolaceus]|uniref:hypothetical protein n=1 Tax=Streptomyces fulvoviolaceus TaxID=285535 RepID=UPI0021C202D9|nr:hypothetical protein [Streptomyces fulvoviolaceus]MCT9078800.1 hypothetical protein [Streptomyces fulvoviolaceus]
MHPDFVKPAEMLPVPKTAGLASDQISGTVCVWCEKAPEVALGPRVSVIGDILCRWWPRACKPCAGREAARVHGIHITTCARCTHREYCPDSRALVDLASTRPYGSGAMAAW